MRIIEPIGDRVIVKRAEAKEVTRNGLVIPETAQERPAEGLVIEVGAGRLLESGARSPVMVAKGDIVLFGKYSGHPIELDDTEFVILREDEIMGREPAAEVVARQYAERAVPPTSDAPPAE